MQNRIRVITKDNLELDSCNDTRARLLVKKKKASFVYIDKELFLKLNKTKEDVFKLINKDQL